MARPKTLKTVESTDIQLTPEEIQAVLALRSRRVNPSDDNRSAGHSELANALITAIESTRAPVKKTPFNRLKLGPWDPKDGTKKPKLKRVMYQHGIELEDTKLSSEEINLLNQIKAGSYCGGIVKVIKRKDRSLDIDYQMKTSSQRLRLVNSFGITSFSSLLNRLISEASDPTKYKGPEDDD